MLWALYGLLHSLLRAAFTETNRAYRLDVWTIAFGQALCGFLLLGCCWHFMAWPADPHFYRAAGGVALIFSVGTMTQLILTAQRAGRVSGIAMPLETFAATAIWILVTPETLVAYRADPSMTACILVAYVLATVALVRIRPQDATPRLFLLVAPLGLTYAVAGVVTKTVMPFFPILPAALTYAFIGFGVMTATLGAGALVSHRGRVRPPSARTLRASGLTGLVGACGYVSFVASVTLAPNPGYTSMLAMLLPVWLLAWHRCLRMEDRASGLAALFIVVATVLLIVAAW